MFLVAVFEDGMSQKPSLDPVLTNYPAVASHIAVTARSERIWS